MIFHKSIRPLSNIVSPNFIDANLLIFSLIYIPSTEPSPPPISANFNRTTAHCNLTTPISDLFQQLNDGKEFSAQGNEIFNGIKLLCLLYENVHESWLSNERIKNWHEKQRPIKHIKTLSHSWLYKNKIVSENNQYPAQQVSATPWLTTLYTTK